MNAAAHAAALERALQTFHAEAQEMVAQMEQCLLALEDDPADRETLNALFRSVHTIKGSAGLFALDALVRFTHQVEGVLDRLRAGTVAFDPALGSVLLACGDQIGHLLSEARERGAEEPSAEVAAESAALLARLAPWAGGTLVTLPGKAGALVPTAAPGAAQPDGVWHISLRFGLDTFLHGIDPLATLRYLGSLGELLLVETFDEALPPLSTLQAEQCHLGFEIRLRTSAEQKTLEDAFEFIQDDCTIHLIPPSPGIEHYARLIEKLPADAERLGDILVACGAITRAQLHTALAQQHTEAAITDTTRPLGTILVEQSAVNPVVLDAALRKQSKARERSDEVRFFRVQADKLDALLNVVGELVTVSSVAKTQAQQQAAPVLRETTDHIGRLVEGIRDATLSLRMVAIGETFNPYRRMVRDIANSLGKEVRLELEGVDTELDKSVVEKISDPLKHLVRNSLDHGLEVPLERQAAGKPTEGVLTLSARHDGGSILIEVRDNGRGIDPEKILRKAKEKGLVPANAAPSREDTLNLIFAPGFSTAEQVSDLSGRGVGMDVVRRNIEALRGSVTIASEVGRGTRMTIRLPLTLAIIDGFVVRCGDSGLVIPLDCVEECIAGGERSLNGGTVGVVDQRGTALPVLGIGHVLGLGGARTARPSVVVVNNAGRRVGLLVDALIGEQQIVIKPLGPIFQRLRGVSGSTILGTGAVGLILDVPALIKLAAERESAALARREHSIAVAASAAPNDSMTWPFAAGGLARAAQQAAAQKLL